MEPSCKITPLLSLLLYSTAPSQLSDTVGCPVSADETIITWTDPDIGTDVALSFQEGQGCNAIWYALAQLCKQCRVAGSASGNMASYTWLILIVGSM